MLKVIHKTRMMESYASNNPTLSLYTGPRLSCAKEDGHPMVFLLFKLPVS